MKRFVAFLLILAMIMVSGAGCAAPLEESESAFTEDVVEGEKKEPSGSSRPIVSDPEKEDEKPAQNESAKEEEKDPSLEEEKEPSSKEEVKDPSKEEPESPSKEEVKEPSKEEEKEENKPNEDQVKEENQPPSQDENENPPSEELPEEDEFFEEDEEYEEDEEDSDYEDPTGDEDYSGGSSAPSGGTPVKPQPKPDSTSSTIKVASYNIKALMYGKDTDGIIQELKEIDADIVGLQEVDKNTTRSGKKKHQIKILAEALGYPYWSFDKLIDFQGGEYGMAILSRYPIVSSEVVQYQDQEPEDSHVRKYGRHVLKVGTKNLAFYNTHLCIRDDNDSVSTKQLKEVIIRMQKDGYAVLTGDFNMPATTLSKTMKGIKSLIPLNDGGAGQIGKKEASKYIDNIIVSSTMEYHTFDNGFGLEVNITPYSDHNLVYTNVSFK